jgi:hypothetical protein
MSLVAPVLAQSKSSIQGAWRVVEVTVTSPNPPPGSRPKGTYTDLQPSLLIFTGKHYSQMNDTAIKPRPTTAFKVAGKPTAEEMQAQWGPFNASSGTYELTGTTLVRHAIVAKNPAFQGSKTAVLRSTIKLDGTNLWLTTTETAAGKVSDPNTVKYVRVE